jgi:hypothetical protein
MNIYFRRCSCGVSITFRALSFKYDPHILDRQVPIQRLRLVNTFFALIHFSIVLKPFKTNTTMQWIIQLGRKEHTWCSFFEYHLLYLTRLSVIWWVFLKVRLILSKPSSQTKRLYYWEQWTGHHLIHLHLYWSEC